MQDWASHKLTCNKTPKPDNDKHSPVRVTSDTRNQPGVRECVEETKKVNMNSTESSCLKQLLVPEAQEESPFDQRPMKKAVISTPRSLDNDLIAGCVKNGLKENNHCVIDDLFSSSHLDKVLKEILEMESDNKFSHGQLSGGRTSGNDKLKVTENSIRNDKIMWVEGNETHIPNISKVVKKMDTILTLFSAQQKDVCISGRTKVSVICEVWDLTIVDSVQ